MYLAPWAVHGALVSGAVLEARRTVRGVIKHHGTVMTGRGSAQKRLTLLDLAGGLGYARNEPLDAGGSEQHERSGKEIIPSDLVVLLSRNPDDGEDGRAEDGQRDDEPREADALREAAGPDLGVLICVGALVASAHGVTASSQRRGAGR